MNTKLPIRPVALITLALFSTLNLPLSTVFAAPEPVASWRAKGKRTISPAKAPPDYQEIEPLPF